MLLKNFVIYYEMSSRNIIISLNSLKERANCSKSSSI